MEITPCEAKRQLKFTELILIAHTIFEFKNRKNIPIIPFLKRLASNNWEFFKQDKPTQERIGIWLSSDSSNCK